MRTGASGLPFSTARAHRSKLPFSLADQKTQVRPEPSTATAAAGIGRRPGA